MRSIYKLHVSECGEITGFRRVPYCGHTNLSPLYKHDGTRLQKLEKLSTLDNTAVHYIPPQQRSYRSVHRTPHIPQKRHTARRRGAQRAHQSVFFAVVMIRTNTGCIRAPENIFPAVRGHLFAEGRWASAHIFAADALWPLDPTIINSRPRLVTAWLEHDHASDEESAEVVQGFIKG